MASQEKTDVVNLQGKRAVVAIDYRHARVFATDTPGHTKPDRVAATDSFHLDHNLFHHAGNTDGKYDIERNDTLEYFSRIAKTLAPAADILLIGHGKGKANASHFFEAFLEKHHPELAAKVVASIRADVDDLTDNQLLRLGQTYFGFDEPVRQYHDSRRGQAHPGQP
jgi:hypothetical protein